MTAQSLQGMRTGMQGYIKGCLARTLSVLIIAVLIHGRR